MEQHINIDDKEHAVDILRRLNDFRKVNLHCDFTIKVGSEELPVHKNVLSASSDYFKAMLSHDNAETRSGIVEIKEVDPTCVKKCVDFIYTGNADVAEDKRGKLMGVAHMMQLQRLCDGIALFLEDGLDPGSFFKTKRIANMYNCKKLEEKCNQFATQRFKDIALSDEFMDLDGEFVSFLMESKETKAKEEVKCKMLLAWTKHDIAGRKECFLNLVVKLALIKMPLSYRRFLIDNEPLVYESNHSLKTLTVSVFNSVDVKSKDVNIGNTGKAIVIFDKSSTRLHALNIDKSWTPMQVVDQNIMQNNFTAVVKGVYIYIFCYINRAVYRLESSNSNAKWKQMANKLLQYNGPAVVLDGFIYTVEWWNHSNTMERFDPIKNQWTELPNKPSMLACESLVATDSRVFCIAGLSQQSQTTAQVEIYDPVTSTWSRDNNSLKTARYYASATATEEGIYVLGGIDNTYNGTVLADVEYRCSVTKTWAVLKPMKSARSSFSSCVIEGKIYAIGGNTANIEEYDPETKEWKIIETLQGKNIIQMASVAIDT